MSDDLDVIAPPFRVVEYLGETIEVRPLTIGQLPAFVRHARPVLAGIFQEGEIDPGPEEVLTMIEEHGDALCKAVAVATGKSADHIGRGNAAEFVQLAMAVIAVNLDFFARRLAPETRRALEALNGAGRTPSNHSSGPGIP